MLHNFVQGWNEDGAYLEVVRLLQRQENAEEDISNVRRIRRVADNDVYGDDDEANAEEALALPRTSNRTRLDPGTLMRETLANDVFLFRHT